MPEITTGRGRAAERGEILETGDRVSSSTVRAAEERYTGTANNKIKGQAEKTDSGEEMGVITEEMGIYPTPYTPNMDSNAVRTGMELGFCEHILKGTG